MQTKLLPGLIDFNYEFFNTENNLKFIHNGEVKNFENLSKTIIDLITNEINKSSDNLKSILENWHPNNNQKQIEQFVSCRLGGLDHKADIKNNQIQQGEYWNCPKRGTCAAEGILCQLPTVNGHQLTSKEITLIQLSTSEKTNEVISEEMNLCFGTYHKMKKMIYQVLGNIMTKQALTQKAFELNLI